MSLHEQENGNDPVSEQPDCCDQGHGREVKEKKYPDQTLCETDEVDEMIGLRTKVTAV